MFIELQNKTTILKLEKIDKIALLKNQIEIVYENDKNNIYIIQNFKTDQRAKEVYQDLKDFINWKPYVSFDRLPENYDVKEVLEQLKKRTHIGLELAISQMDIKLNHNAIFEIPKE